MRLLPAHTPLDVYLVRSHCLHKNARPHLGDLPSQISGFSSPRHTDLPNQQAMARPLSFLDLPAGVRKRIYADAGLVRPCYIDLRPGKGARDPPLASSICFYRQKRSGITHLGRTEPDCYCPRLPTELLLVSKAVHDEVLDLLYSQNKFLFRGHNCSDLTPLRRISARALAAMTSLLIRLNCWPCFNGHNDIWVRPSGDRVCVDCRTFISNGDPAWGSTDPVARGWLPQWENLFTHLSSSISPKRLRLTFICDVQDLESAELVVRPLTSLPTLAACTIRLGRRRDQYPLAALAREASLRLTRSYIPPPTAFRFQALPPELRFRILEFADLGRQVLYERSLLHIEKGKLILGTPDSVFHPICCYKCVGTFADCCCPTTRASYAPSCTCRVLPMELFLVSKQMYQDASSVFYPASCFDFLQNHRETVAFLSRLPRAGLGLIRRLRIAVTAAHFHEWELSGHASQFRTLVEFIRDNMDVTKLELTIDTHAIDDDCLWIDGEEENRFVYGVYLDIANTLCLLRGLWWVEFDIGWAPGLVPWLTQEVLGRRRWPRDVRGGRTIPPAPGFGFEGSPSWHKPDVRLANSNYARQGS